MGVRPRGNRFEVSYRCPGYTKPFYESYKTEEEANLRFAKIQYELKLGVFTPPAKYLKSGIALDQHSPLKVFLPEFVRLYGLNNWGDGYLSRATHYIEHYINPYIGDVALENISPHFLESYYTSLLTKPAVCSNPNTEAKTKKISVSVIQKIHTLLRSALGQAVKWQYLSDNPADLAKPPHCTGKKRSSWNTAELIQAIRGCNNQPLRLALLLASACSMREGEILGLQWSHIKISDESLSAAILTDEASSEQYADKIQGEIHIQQELKRCDSSALNALRERGRDKVYFTFPPLKKAPCATELVLKTPKTLSSVRTVYIGATVVRALLDMKRLQRKQKKELGDQYCDYDLVIAQKNGRPIESRMLRDMLNELIKESGLPQVVFHSLRHTSTSIKLKLSCGNIKAVQGDTGHADASMVTDQYAFIENEDRKDLAQKFEREVLTNLWPEKSLSERTSNKIEISQETAADPQTKETVQISSDNMDPRIQEIVAILTRKSQLIPIIYSVLEHMQ